MHAAVKILLGLILLIIGIAWYLIGIEGVPLLGDLLGSMTIYSFLDALFVLFFGVFGLLIILVGVILLWLGIEDMRAPAIREEFEAPPVTEPKKKQSTKKSTTKKSTTKKSTKK